MPSYALNDADGRLIGNVVLEQGCPLADFIWDGVKYQLGASFETQYAGARPGDKRVVSFNVTPEPAEPEKKYVWVVKKNRDTTEGRGPMIDAAVCESEQEAYDYNYNVGGTMGNPRHHGGEIWRIELGTYPIEQTKIWGTRQRWDGVWDNGWIDLRDKPNPEDPEYKEFLRLKEKFQPGLEK